MKIYVVEFKREGGWEAEKAFTSPCEANDEFSIVNFEKNPAVS